MSDLRVEYGWRHASECGSHEYLLPAVLREVSRISSGTPLRILDLGCGNGYISSQLARLGHTVIGVDSSTDGIVAASDAFADQAANLSFHVCSVYEDRLARIVGDSVDCVIAIEVIEHLYLPRFLFDRSYAVLRRGGHLVVTTPYHGYIKNLAISIAGGWDRHWSPGWDGGHVKFFSKRTLAQLAAEAGFQQLEFRGIGRVLGLWKSMMLTAEKR